MAASPMGAGEGESMHEEAEVCCGEAGDLPLFPSLLRLADTDAEGRRRLGNAADDRMAHGLTAMTAGAADARRATTIEARRAAAAQVRAGLSDYESGAAARAALVGGEPPRAVALNWFRSELNLPTARHQPNASWFGLSPTHLLFMTLLGLTALGLLALQVLRLRRVHDLVRATAAAPAVAAPLPQPSSVPAALPAPAADARLAAPAHPLPAPARSRSWSGELRVAHIMRETPTVTTFRLVNPASDRLPFDFLPGQFLQVAVEPEPGKTIRRSYTIASSPTQSAFVEITVKREAHGTVSSFLHDKVAAGDLLKVSGPFGNFTFTGSDADSIVLVAGGVGITPMMSVLRYLTDTAWPGEIFFVYGARSTDEFVFREEIERLERRHDRLHVLATMQRSPGTAWLGPEGHLTKELLQSAVPDIGRRRVHLCGPPPMMASVKRMLEELGVPSAQVHTEAFGPASLPAENAPEAATSAPVAAPPAVKAAVESGIAAATVTFAVSGVSAPLAADETILEAAEEAGVEIPYACRVGECGVCVTKLRSGEVTMAVETGLDPADKAQGYVLACQAKSAGSPLVVEA